MKSIFCHKAKAAPPAANTLRFEFGNQSYSPVTAGVGSSGTWKRCEFMPGNVWDWTNKSSSWLGAFLNSLLMSTVGEVSVIAAGDTSFVSNIRSIFQNCTGLTHVEPFDTQNVTTMYWAFANCSNLRDVPLLNTAKATTMFQAFRNCALVTSGTLALYNQASTQTTPPSVTTECFNNCGSGTETGAAELAQIPQSWGGTKEEA